MTSPQIQASSSPSLSVLSNDTHQSSMLPPSSVSLRINSDPHNTHTNNNNTSKSDVHDQSISSFFADSPRNPSHTTPYTPIGSYSLHSTVPMTPTHNNQSTLSTPTNKLTTNNDILSPSHNKSLIDPLFDIGRCVWVERTIRDKSIYWPAQVTAIHGHNSVVPRLTLNYLGQKHDTITVFADTVHPFINSLDKYAYNTNGRNAGGLDFMDAVTAAVSLEEKYTNTDNDMNNNKSDNIDSTSDHTIPVKSDDMELSDITGGVQIHPHNTKHSTDTNMDDNSTIGTADEHQSTTESTANTPTNNTSVLQPTAGSWSNNNMFTSPPTHTIPQQQTLNNLSTPSHRNAASDISNIVVGSRIRLRTVDQIHHKLRDFALTEAEITDVPVHPNTWYGVRLCDGTELKLRKSAFDLLGEGSTPLPFSGPAAYVPGQFLLSSVTPPRVNKPIEVNSKVILLRTEETAPYPVLIGQHASVVEQPNNEVNLYALQLSNGHVIQLPRQAFMLAEPVINDTNNNTLQSNTQDALVYAQSNGNTTDNISGWLLNQPVRITHGIGGGSHGIVQSIIGDAISIQVVNQGTINKRLDQVQVLVDASTQAAYYAYLQQQQQQSLNMSTQRPSSLNITDDTQSITQYSHLSPSHVNKFGHQLQIRPRNNNRQLLHKYVTVLNGRMKNQIGIVTRGANGYFTVRFLRQFDSLLEHDNSIMKRSSDLRQIIIPPDVTPEQFAERMYQQSNELTTLDQQSLDDTYSHTHDAIQYNNDYIINNSIDDINTSPAKRHRRSSPTKSLSPGKSRNTSTTKEVKPKRDMTQAANVLMDIFQKSTPTPKAAELAKKRDWPAAGSQIDDIDTNDIKLLQQSTTPSISATRTPNKLSHDYDAHLNLVTPRNTSESLRLSTSDDYPVSGKSTDLASTSSFDSTTNQIHRSRSPSPSIHAPTSNIKRLSYDHIPTNNSNAGNNVLQILNNHLHSNGNKKPQLSIDTDENIPHLEHINAPTTNSADSLITPTNSSTYQHDQYNAFTPSNLFASPQKVGSLAETDLHSAPKSFTV